MNVVRYLHGTDAAQAFARQIRITFFQHSLSLDNDAFQRPREDRSVTLQVNLPSLRKPLEETRQRFYLKASRRPLLT